MDSHIFIKKNLDILLISIESLDPYILEDIIFNSNTFNLIELFIIRNKNCMRYEDQISFLHYCKILIILQQISQIFCRIEIQKNLNIIFKEYIYCNVDSKEVEINNYLKRFQVNYRKSIEPYLLGQKNYNYPENISDLAIINLFILYQMNSLKGTYILLLYLIIKNITIPVHIPRQKLS
uniref:Uncharacterized protein n=1 Tax=Lympha mucosa TaxID=2045360 RepID=A0A6B9VP56_9FLOR|nr:hypothetical protein [Lympha mucosa]